MHTKLTQYYFVDRGATPCRVVKYGPTKVSKALVATASWKWATGLIAKTT